LARCRSEIRKGAFDALSEAEKKMAEDLCLPTEFVSVENWKSAPTPCTERARLTRHAQVTTLWAQGLGNAEIARRTGISARTLRDWQKKGFPEAGRRRKRLSKFDPYAPYVLSRWEQGCTNGLQIYSEIKEKGYTGTLRVVYRFLVPLRRKVRIIQKAESPHTLLQDFSAKEAVWLFMRGPAKLDEKKQATLTAICQASETARTTYQLVQDDREHASYTIRREAG
jgi:transposase